MALHAALLALVVSALALRGAEAIVKELYTTNAVCKQNNCVNPIFPALHMLPNLEGQEWKKYNIANVSKFMGFCKPFVNYDVGLPATNHTIREKIATLVKDVEDRKPIKEADMPKYADPIQDAVVFQDRLAAKMYFYHLSGLGMEAWDHTTPAEESYHPLRPCARSVAAMVCYTHFPQAFDGLPETSPVSYLRPCRNSCESYVQECNVECCDESVTCVWDGSKAGNTVETTQKQTVAADGKNVLLQMGYADFVGPSLHCTGSRAVRTVRTAVTTTLMALLALWSMLL